MNTNVVYTGKPRGIINMARYLTFCAFRANLKKSRDKHEEKESTSVGTLQRDFQLYRGRSGSSSAGIRNACEQGGGAVCCEEMRKGGWNMALEWQG